MDISASGKRISISGIPYFLRGTGDFVINPETGCPDTDRNRWRKKLKRLKDYGYNYVRCQSYAPTPEYLDVADEIGLVIQSEIGVLGAWAGNSVWHGYGWPKPTPAFRGKLIDQWRKVVMRDVNHPSAAIYCMSNELGDGTVFPRTAWQCYDETKKIKPGSLVLWTDGGHNQDLPADFVKGEASLAGKVGKPVIQHEYRWWSTYPDIRIKQKYSNTAMRPIAIEMAEERAEKWGLGHMLPVMARNSHKLQYCEAKDKMEGLRRDNPELAGVCHFTAMDVGFSPQGILDEFYERKHATPCMWRRCWGDTVLMIEKGFDDRVLVGGENLVFDLYISDFSHPPLDSPGFRWWLEAGGKVVEKGVCVSRHQAFRTHKVGRIEVELPEIRKPEKLLLRAQASDGIRSFSNIWKFTVFPKERASSNSVAVYRCEGTWASSIDFLPEISSEDLGEKQGPPTIMSGTVDDKLKDYLSRGGRVVLAAGEGLVKPFTAKLGLKEGRYYFLPPANYPPLGDGNSGTIISPHPITDELPHEGWADLEFYRLIKDSPPIDLAALGVPRAETIIRSLSTYFTCRPMAYLVEFRVGKGGMIICALDLDQTLPEARYLLSKIVQYANGAEFSPPNTMGVDKLELILSLIPPVGFD